MTLQAEKASRDEAPPQMPAGAPPQAARSAAANRRTSRRGLLISVLVIALGGVLAFSAARLLTQRSEVLVVARDVNVGQVITAGDLTTVRVTDDPALASVPAVDRGEVVGQVAKVRLVKGSLLAAGQYGPNSGFLAGQVQVALALAVGQLPARGLVPGQHVLIVATPGRGGATAAEPSPGVAAKGVNATVAGVGDVNGATQVTVVDVQVPAESGVAVAQLASTGNLALILLPDD